MTKPFLLPRVIGHRGAKARAPENTLAGFRRAAALGCRWVEFDVRLTADDHPVVFHDDKLDRTTDGSGSIGMTSLAELLGLDAGAKFDPAYRGEPIPTLDQTLALIVELGLGCDLEMKADPGREATLAYVVAQALANIEPTRLPILAESFSVPVLTEFARQAPAIGRALAWEQLPDDWLDTAAQVGAVSVVLNHEHLNRQQVDLLHRADLSVQVYTVNDPERAKELFSWGVDSVISDAPDTILASRPRSDR